MRSAYAHKVRAPVLAMPACHQYVVHAAQHFTFIPAI